MLKGHTKIELTDVNTGKKEVHEKENMITNAVRDMVNKKLWLKETASSSYPEKIKMDQICTPLRDKAFGGIILFENPLEENADKYAIPAPQSNPITGYADSAVNAGADTKRGSRNLTESTELSNGYKYVYDFTTNQGNGQISSLALTNVITGKEPLKITAPNTNQYLKGNIVEVSLSSDNFEICRDLLSMVEYDFSDNTFTCIAKINETEVRRRKYGLNLSVLRLKGQMLSPVLLSEETVESSSTVNRDSVFVDGNDGYVYCLYKSSGSTPLQVSRIKRETLKYDEVYGMKQITLTASVSIYATVHRASSPTNISKVGAAVIKDNKLFVGYQSNVVKIDLSNTEDITYISAMTVSRAGDAYPLCVYDGRILYGKTWIYDDDTTAEANSGSYSFTYDANGNYMEYAYFTAINKGIWVQAQNYNGSTAYIKAGLLLQYLATINNLDMPVVKTADKTMKITYTLTEE